MIRKYFYSAAPHWVLVLQSFLFSILWGVWVLHNTAHIVNTCLILGAVLSLPTIYFYRRLLITRAALPIWLIGLLFIWVSFHLLFLSNNYLLQLWEYTHIWRSAFFGSIFALGLGINLGVCSDNPKRTKIYWAIIYFGFFLPTLIYYVRFLLGYGVEHWAFNIPPYLLLNNTDIFGSNWVMKASYVFFCLPVFAIALGRIYQLSQEKHFPWLRSTIYFLTLPLVLCIMYLEDARNGIGWAAVVVGIFVIALMASQLRRHFVKTLVLACILISLILGFGYHQLQKNPQWKTLFIDLQLATQMKEDPSEAWKGFSRPPPINSQGVMASGSNYQRGAWAILGFQFIGEYPMGYGVITTSFKEIATSKWPESDLSQAHSAWIDFTLSEGIPGGLILFMAAILVCLPSRRFPLPWSALCTWGPLAVVLLFITTEVSHKYYVEAFILLIMLAASIRISSQRALITDALPRRDS